MEMNFKEKLPFVLPLFFSFIVLYYPIFFGYWISPNDIYLNYDPWRYGSFEYSSLNPTLNDPATSYWTKAYLFKTEPRSLFFNPYIASGMPGAIDLFSGILNPFVLIPLIFPVEMFFGLMVFLKIIVSYTGMYLFLKTFDLNKWTSSFGATVYSFFGQNVVWALWPQTNISSLFPWFLYGLKIKNRAYKFLVFFLLFIFSFTGGYPPYLIIFFYFYLLHLLLVEIREILNKFKTLILPFILAFFVLLPFLYITYIDLKDSGRLKLRENLSQKENPFPLKGLVLFFCPYKFGAPQDFSLDQKDGFYSLTLYSGIFGILFLPFGFFLWKNSRKRFFIISFILLFFLLFFNSPLRFIVSKLPGITYSSFSRISILLGLSLSIVSAFGFEKIFNLLKNKKIMIFIVILGSINLGFFASKFFSYQKYNKIKPEETPSIIFLKEKLRGTPFRVAGFYDSLWPNSSEYTKIPDIRSHFSSESWWREFLSLGYPDVSNVMGTFLLFWDARAINSPLFSSLFVKYITEPPFIDTIMPQLNKKKYIEYPEEFIKIPPFGLKRKFQFEGIPYFMEIPLKNFSPKVYLNIYDYFSQVLLERLEVQERGGTYVALFEKPQDYYFSKVYIEIVSEKDVEVGVVKENFCLNISYSPYMKVYEGKDLKIFENLSLKEPLYLIFEARDGFPEREEFFHWYAYFSKEDFLDIEEFLNKGKEINKTGNVKVLNLSLYGGDFRVSTKANSILVLPFKYNKFWSEATMDGEKAKIYKVNGGMSGILVPQGEHIVNFEYGKKFLIFIYSSAILFVLGILIFLFLF